MTALRAEDYVDVRTAARVLCVHENTIRNWCASGVIREFVRLPGSGFRRIAWSEVLRLDEEMSRDDSDPDTID